jgi:hypothetical protein
MYVEGKPDVLFAGLGQMDLSDYQIALGARRPSFSSPVTLSIPTNPAFVGGGLGQYRVPSLRKGMRPVKVKFARGVPSIAGFGADVDPGTAIAIGTAGLVVSAVVSFGIMTLASYVGARWAGCRRS